MVSFIPSLAGKTVGVSESWNLEKKEAVGVRPKATKKTLSSHKSEEKHGMRWEKAPNGVTPVG